VIGVLCIVEFVQLVLVRNRARANWKGAVLAANGSCSN
jgi:hypothetical protein